ncbi:hypothetical protein LPB19_07515 [Marinobacter salinisoli]|uniref:Uncharacterized protein n=1 Tax=Marinobacter salinisoli TaxID=2769486 RepID=A0ABX7MV65_9GAMM|nr:hypothetical protein [Marinobacter salinisoli]QSP96216.1 hypothetical protein LPB19_07515 [Marinobacter salinisoli]
MTRIPVLSVPVFVLALAGCGEESAQSPLDGRDFDGVAYSEPAPYSGKVMDGYLKNARVWLDMDGDSQYTPGPMTVTLDNGNQVVLESGEPTAMSGPGGEFSLDIAELQVPTEVGPDLNPSNYPLFALTLPGKTLEETYSGDVPVESAYLLSAAPGIRVISPLSMLSRFRSMLFLTSGTNSDLPQGLASLNLVRDYIQAQDEQAHAYARAFVRFLTSQFPETYNGVLAQANADGTERLLSQEAAHLLGVSLVKHASTIVKMVDEAAAYGNYASVDAKLLSLPEVPINLNDPVLVTSQRIYAHPGNQSNLPVSGTRVDESAGLQFFYSEDGRVRSVDVNGCIFPSMAELARIVRHGGYMANLGTQWLPSVSLAFNESLLQFTNDRDVDERLVFDWDNQTILFDSATTCHQELGIEAGSELGGAAEVTYTWDVIDGVVNLTARMRGANDSVITRQYSSDPTWSNGTISGFSLTENAVEQVSLALSGDMSACSGVSGLDPVVGQLVSATQGYSVSGYEPQPANFENLTLEFDVRSDGDDQLHRLLRFGFLNDDMAGFSNVIADAGFEWQMFYATVGSAEFVPGQPNLIAVADLLRFGGSKGCGEAIERAGGGLFASVRYSYQSLSDHLIGLIR